MSPWTRLLPHFESSKSGVYHLSVRGPETDFVSAVVCRKSVLPFFILTSPKRSTPAMPRPFFTSKAMTFLPGFSNWVRS